MAQETEQEDVKKILAEAWARFAARISHIRSAVFTLMRDIDTRRRDKELDEVRRRLQKL